MTVDEELEEVEGMAAFFDTRADGYDEHIRGFVFTPSEFDQFYGAVAAPIEKTSEVLKILDLGCGTGLELAPVFEKVPKAHITGVDLSANMLEQLRNRYSTQMDQITLVKDSYLTLPLGDPKYDYILSVLSLHHLLHDRKRKFYTILHAALKPGGKYIEGDSVTRKDTEPEFIAEYKSLLMNTQPASEGYYHIDVPLSLNTQRQLLIDAGFRNFEVLWQRDSTAVWNTAVYVVTA